ncbi:restriction endonuclease subunit S [Thauera aromatica]|uniref:restriction endonuclease subunit S n=1 Tax=Thauera aromatica TaxID=59405 RepID=UPI001FFC7E2E|nr:restriction endonuclease subunit S [Thauera aromatica]MCK2089031.1 restriction endonuclease subunit S [Thauera aromatica]
MAFEHQPRFFGDLVNFVAEKAKAEHASFTTYISTENMLSSFGGVTTAATLPGSGSVTRFKTGDTLFSNIRTYFKKVWQAEFDGHCSNDVLVFRPKDETVLCSNYLHYLCRWEKFTEFSARTSKDAKMPRGDKDALAQFQFELPPIEEQITMAGVLRRLDNKITVNRRINQALQAIGQAIFKSWFVDFDPVKAKIAAKQEGRDPLRAAMSAISGTPDDELDALPSEQYAQLAANAALFPDEMEESELGEIPRGWACGALGDICSFTAGSAFKPEHQGSTEGDFPFIKVSDMNLAGNEVFIQSANNYVSKSQQSEMKAKLHPSGATVFAKIGVALISNRRRLLTAPTIIDNNLMSASPAEGKSGQYFLYSLLSTLDFNTLVSGTALPYINVSDLKKIPIVRPPYDACHAFEAKASSFFSMMQTLAAQSSTLATTRDALLPKLLSGEIEASRTVEG